MKDNNITNISEFNTERDKHSIIPIFRFHDRIAK